jgi:xylose isomerase
VKDFARGCMRTYLIFKERAAKWNADPEIQQILKELAAPVDGLPSTKKYSPQSAQSLLTHNFSKDAIMTKHLPYERLDQLTIDIITGTR